MHLIVLYLFLIPSIIYKQTAVTQLQTQLTQILHLIQPQILQKAIQLATQLATQLQIKLIFLNHLTEIVIHVFTRGTNSAVLPTPVFQ